MHKNSSVYVVLATYNEIQNLLSLLPEILEILPTAKIIVVDDSSPDGTPAALQEMRRQDQRIIPLIREGKLGYGTAVLAGMRQASDLHAQEIITLDADFSHNPSDIPKLLKALHSHDVAIGSRYAQGVIQLADISPDA